MSLVALLNRRVYEDELEASPFYEVYKLLAEALQDEDAMGLLAGFGCPRDDEYGPEALHFLATVVTGYSEKQGRDILLSMPAIPSIPILISRDVAQRIMSSVFAELFGEDPGVSVFTVDRCLEICAEAGVVVRIDSSSNPDDD